MSAPGFTASDELARPHSRIWAIAGPAILANSSEPMLGLVDTWAIGHLPSPVHLAAVGLGSVIFNYLLWSFGFLRMGTTGMVAQAKGRKDDEGLITIVIRSCALALFFALLLLLFQQALLLASLRIMAPPDSVATITAEYFNIRIWASPATLLSYAVTGVLFGLARVRVILYLQLMLNLTNAALNLLFVIGFDMGVAGVAWGTLIAQWLTALVSIRVLLGLLDIHLLKTRIVEAATWRIKQFGSLMFVNGFIFIRTIFLMTALALIMRVAGNLGEAEMAASHIMMQFLLLISLGMDGFAHAAEALAGSAWGAGNRQQFRRWVILTSLWALFAAVFYMLLFGLFGNAIAAMLTDLHSVRLLVAGLLPLLVALPLVAVWCYQFDGVYIGATAALPMMVTMGLAFVVYLAILVPFTQAWGLWGLWMAVLVFMAARGLCQAAWYPWLERKLA
ncbi:MAG TPA: MATE family efflux transporter [Xanthomonadales bacterium]|nr:MATE family efflux transporter [Xanthomonadales bacterium]